MADPPLKSELPASFTFSQSSLQDYADCPRLFQLRYLERLAWPAVEMEPVLENERRQRAGQAFHRLVQQHLTGLPVEKLDCLPDTPDLRRWWENYLKDPELQGLNTGLKVEIILSAPVGKHHLMAKYDLIVVTPEGKARIYDWKTTKKRPRDEWAAARLQTRVYRALLIQAGAFLNNGKPLQPEQVEMVYWYAEHPGKPARFPYSPAQHQRDWSGLSGMIQEISNHRFFPPSEEGKKCAYCSYRSYCNRGEKAGQLEEAESDMERAESEFRIDFEQVGEIEF